MQVSVSDLLSKLIKKLSTGTGVTGLLATCSPAPADIQNHRPKPGSMIESAAFPGFS